MTKKTGDEIHITEIENEIMQVFVKRKILSDSQIVNNLTELANKLDNSEKGRQLFGLIQDVKSQFSILLRKAEQRLKEIEEEK